MAGEINILAARVPRPHFLKARIDAAGIPAALIGFCLLSSASVESVKILGYQLPPLCPFKMFTGFDCPGCGITRALIFAFHGQWQQSYLMHLWGIPLAVLLVARLITALFNLKWPAIFPKKWQSWKNHFVMLSLLVPWMMKTVALLFIRFS